MAHIVEGDHGPAVVDSLHPTDKKIIKALTAQEPRSVQDISKATGIKVGTLRARLHNLVEERYVIPTASVNSPKRAYLLPKE